MSIVGLDVGTSRVKAVRFDEAWRAADVYSEPNEVVRFADGRREQDMEQLWAAAARVLATVVRRSPDDVELVAITAQGDGCWLVDAAGIPVRPAMLWNDGRSAAIVHRWRAEGLLDAAFRHNGCQGAPGTAHAQLAWLREHDPAVLEQSQTLLSCGSWIYFRLTGATVLEATDAANPFFDARTRRYDPSVLELFGLGELDRLLPEVVAGPDRTAPLQPAVAAELGLRPGTSIALAPYDVPATAIGTGAVNPGAAFAVLGTTLCVGTVARDPMLDRPVNGMTLPGTAPDRWLIAYATMSGTEVLEWMAMLLGLADARAVVDLADTARSDDLPLLLPYLSPAGERSPFLDPSMRGILTGLQIGNTRAEVARAALEGLALVVKDCLQVAGHSHRLVVCGGGSQSDLWCQMICDATGLPVQRTETTQVGALGAAVNAAADMGLYPSLDDAVRDAIGGGTEFEPDPTALARYAARYRRLLETRAAVQSIGPNSS